MASHNDRLLYLFNKYFEGTLSDGEKVEFAQLVDKQENFRTIEDLVTKELHAFDSTKLADDPALESKASMLLRNIVGDVPVVSINRKKTSSIRIAWAAASIVFLCLIGYWTFETRTKFNKNAAAKQQQKIDVLPGKRNAMLTLSDGSIVNLDSTKDGNIAEDGSAIIRKDGERLVYSSQSRSNAAVLYNTISTARGNEYSAVLSDGTKVWLNAESTITFPAIFTGPERHVKISGEVYFEVTSNKQIPFTVSFGKDAVVKVLGTSFNINSYEDEEVTKTTLREGSIQIKDNGKFATLQPRDQALIQHGSPMKIVSDVDVDAVVAWKDGYFDFENADIRTIMKQLSRWYDLTVDYQGNTNKNLFTGQINRSLTLSSVLKILEKTKVQYQLKEGRKLTIMP